jgi:competence protein ComGC
MNKTRELLEWLVVILIIAMLLITFLSSCSNRIHTVSAHGKSKELTTKNFGKHYRQQLNHYRK